MKERPILFSAPMVRAILAGTKTQTRRVVKPQPVMRDGDDCVIEYANGKQRHSGPADYLLGHVLPTYACPYGQPGDRLWVREGFTPLPMQAPTDKASRWQICYAAGGAEEREAPAGYNPMLYNYERWSPSIHMPRWASRITLEITGVRVERLQAISEADAWAEGCMRGDPNDAGGWFPADEPDPSGIGERGWDCARDWFADLWESINGHDSWEANPWVWVVEFRRVRP